MRRAIKRIETAIERWPGTPITLRQGARVIEDSQAPARGVESIISTLREVKKAPGYRGFKLCSSGESRGRLSPRRSDFYPRTQITLTAVQKMQVVVQKMIFAQAAHAGGSQSQKL